MSELHEAASTGDLQTLEDELSKGLDPNEPDPEWGGKTPLHVACGVGHKRCVHALLMAGAKVNAITDAGWTPAHSACETGQVHCLKSLLSAGCDVNISDRSGDTAHRIAEIYGQATCRQAIEEHKKKQAESDSHQPGGGPDEQLSSTNTDRPTDSPSS